VSQPNVATTGFSPDGGLVPSESERRRRIAGRRLRVIADIRDPMCDIDLLAGTRRVRNLAAKPQPDLRFDHERNINLS